MRTRESRLNSSKQSFNNSYLVLTRKEIRERDYIWRLNQSWYSRSVVQHELILRLVFVKPQAIVTTRTTTTY